MDVVDQLIARMRAANRMELLRFLGFIINTMTVVGRASYENDTVAADLRFTNEGIHYVAGHLRGLCDPDEAFTESRAAGVAEQLRRLGPDRIAWINEHMN